MNAPATVYFIKDADIRMASPSVLAVITPVPMPRDIAPDARVTFCIADAAEDAPLVVMRICTLSGGTPPGAEPAGMRIFSHTHVKYANYKSLSIFEQPAPSGMPLQPIARLLLAASSSLLLQICTRIVLGLVPRILGAAGPFGPRVRTTGSKGRQLA